MSGHFYDGQRMFKQYLSFFVSIVDGLAIVIMIEINTEERLTNKNSIYSVLSLPVIIEVGEKQCMEKFTACLHTPPQIAHTSCLGQHFGFVLVGIIFWLWVAQAAVTEPWP